MVLVYTSCMDSYQLLDFGNEQRLEQWGAFTLVRPDPTAIDWPQDEASWKKADAVYDGEKGKGEWKKKKDIPEHWTVAFDDLLLHARLTPYKHTGIFPEQQANWNWTRKIAKKSGRALNILNLFAYTGAATVALAKDGHFVTHVDSARPSIGWAKENALLNAIPETGIRWMLEDASKFAEREYKRGKKYDAIILDPPAFGHSPTGKTWRIERDLKPILEHCAMLLSDTPSFVVLNGYAVHDTPESFQTLLSGVLHAKGPKIGFRLEAEELLLTAKDGRTLSTGIVTRAAFDL